MDATKYCGSCQLPKCVNDFNKSSLTRDGYDYRCKSCSVEYVRQWTANNRTRVNERERSRYANNPQHRISHIMHVKINSTLRRVAYTEELEDIIELFQIQFLDWISFNFNDKMNWTNYGRYWQFDLVIPASSFDLTVDVQLHCAFNWSNIRPCI